MEKLRTTIIRRQTMTDKRGEIDNLITDLNSALKEAFEYVPLSSVIVVADILYNKGYRKQSEDERSKQ